MFRTGTSTPLVFRLKTPPTHHPLLYVHMEFHIMLSVMIEGKQEKCLTSTVASTPHPVKRAPSAHAVVASAPTTGPVIWAGSLHTHGFAGRLIMCSHLSATTLEDFNVPTSTKTEIRPNDMKLEHRGSYIRSNHRDKDLK